MASKIHADKIFFVGSGVAALSGLPLFSPTRDSLSFEFAAEADNRLEQVSIESILTLLAGLRIDVAAELREMFNSVRAKPNAIHYILATYLHHGATIWTTNYDTLLEEAVEASRGTLVTCQTVSSQCEALGRIRKPHGTFIRGESGRWESDQGLFFGGKNMRLSWPQHYATHLVEESAGSHLTIIGYSGQDIAPYRHLKRAIDVAASVTWHEHSADIVRKIASRYELGVSQGNKRVVLDQGSQRFLNDHRGFGDGRGHGYPGPPGDYEPLARGLNLYLVRPSTRYRIFEMAGERRLAEEHLDQMWQDWWSRRWQARPNLPWRDVLRSTLRYKVRDRHLRGSREFLIRMALTLPYSTPYLESFRSRSVAGINFPDSRHEYHLDRLAYWAKSARKPVYRARLLIARSRCLRELGEYRKAIDSARSALDVAIQHDLATEAAHAQFEIVEAARSIGDFVLARAHISLRMEHIAMVHWSAWLSYERGCLEIQIGRNYRQALEEIRTARCFFSGESSDRQYNSAQGLFYCRLATVALLRCKGKPRRALAELQRIPETELDSSAIRRGAYFFQKGEAHRALDEYEEAEHAYLSIDPSVELHGALRLAGLALLRVARSEDAGEALDEARSAFKRHSCRWGVDLIDEQQRSVHSGKQAEARPPQVRFL